MAKSCIPGYEDALEHERRLREEACLGDTASICGIRIHHVTPYLLARLFRMETPYMGGSGEYTEAETIRFLWAMSVEFSTDAGVRELFIAKVVKRLSETGYAQAEQEIEDFLTATFLDAPMGGVDSAPVVSSPAWMIHKMMKQYPQMTRQDASNTPIALIYQFMRCEAREKGDILYNPSDKLKADWMAGVRAEWEKNRGNN